MRECVALAAGTTTRIVVNDRLDVAIASGAHGVHLRERGIDVANARRISGAGLLIGRSVHSAEAAIHARSADYLIAGSVFPTASKPGEAASLGLEGLRDVVRAAGDCAVWAVGGITAERLPEVVRCGARGIAAIGVFIPADRSLKIGQAVETLTRTLRFSFDTPVELF